MQYARVVNVLTIFRLYVREMNEENFEHKPVNVGFLYTEMSKVLPEWGTTTVNGVNTVAFTYTVPGTPVLVRQHKWYSSMRLL